MSSSQHSPPRQLAPTMRSLPLRRLSVCVALALAPAFLPAQANAAGAFGSCDGSAFLTQGMLSRTYALDIQSGDYKVATTHHSNQTEPQWAWTDKASLNALGFNANDGFAYGWSNFHRSPVRIHSDWSVEPIKVELQNPYMRLVAGDVSSRENRYYAYSNGHDAGLFAMELDPNHGDYLQLKQLASSEKLDLNWQDFAVHPENGLIYGVGPNGDVIELNPDTLEIKVVGNAKVYGNLGAQFFGDDGQLLVSRDYDGTIFSVDLTGNMKGKKFAKGPSSTTQDGMRCLNGSGGSGPQISADFGDAPDSYGTSLAADGARHLLADSNNALRLGSTVDAESDAYGFPLADNDEGADEDGVKFITRLVEGQTARMAVEASGEGFLSVWVDTNGNGAFQPSEQHVDDHLVSAGENIIALPMPNNVRNGETWARVRLSTAPGLGPTGSAPDGEVEDYQVSVLEDPLTVARYPANTGYSTVAFEDNWPFVGDYDMNDLVVRMRTRTHKNSQGYQSVDIQGYVTAAGAFYHNGFAIRLPGVERSAIDEANLRFELSDVGEPVSPLEAERKEAIFVITDDVFKHVTPGASCDYYRSESKCGADLEFKFALSIPFLEPQTADLSGVFDPFLFATPGEFHGDHFVAPPGRSYEIHLKNQAPTEAFDPTLFAGVGQDKSDPAQGLYFQTGTGMPWALEMSTDWQHPYEYTELSRAYPGFSAFATSGGAENADWFLHENAVADLIYPE